MTDSKKTLHGWVPPAGPYPSQFPVPSWSYPPAPPQPPPQTPAHSYELPAYLQPGVPPPALPPARPIAYADATVGVSARVRFIRLTYLHLLLAILAFAGLEYLLMTNDVLVANVSSRLVTFALGGRWNWSVVLVAFMGVSWIADAWASNARSRFVQYAGLAFYVVAEALIFVPLLAIVQWKTHDLLARGGAEPHIIRDAAFITLGLFGTLTLSVLVTKKDFSYLRGALAIATGAALATIALSLVFGFNLGLVFSCAMVVLAGAYILYYTSQVLAHFDPRHHVSAALALFSSVALMFWYVIRILLRANR